MLPGCARGGACGVWHAGPWLAGALGVAARRDGASGTEVRAPTGVSIERFARALRARPIARLCHTLVLLATRLAAGDTVRGPPRTPRKPGLGCVN